MKIAFYLTLLLTMVGCSGDKPLEFPLNDDKFAGFAMNCQYEPFFASKDSSCIEVITRDQLKKREEITIKLSDHCDSVEIEIPPGGTITSADLYKDSILKNPIASVPGFTIGEFISNHFTVSSKLRGRYFLHYGSCHWWSELWINFE